MATTRLTDIVQVESFEKAVEGKITENSKLRQSGIVVPDQRIIKKAQTAGFNGVLPFWKPTAGGEAATMNDDPAVAGTPAKVQQGSMTARMLQRALAFEAMDIADYASDSDAIAYAASEFARLWVADEESAILAILAGLLADNAANDSGDMIHDVSVATGSQVLLGGTVLGHARKQLGDAGGELKYLFAHSDVVNNLRIAEPNAFVPASQTNIGLETYQGYVVVETDNVGVNTTTEDYPVYTTYFTGGGLFGYGAGSFGSEALAQVRDEFAGNFSGKETIISRRRYLVHPFGFSNIVAPTNGVSQANSELDNAATWNRVISRKAIPLVAVKTNG